MPAEGLTDRYDYKHVSVQQFSSIIPAHGKTSSIDSFLSSEARGVRNTNITGSGSPLLSPS